MGIRRPVELPESLVLDVLMLVVLAQTPPRAADDLSGPPPVVNVLSSLSASATEDLARRFEAAHPGVKVELTCEADEGALRQLRNHGSQFDVVLGLSILALGHAADERLLKPHRAPSADQVGADFRDREDRWYAYFLEAAAIAYNTGAFGRGLLGRTRELPTDYADLANQRFQGEIAVGSPSLYSLTGYVFLCLIEAARQEARDETRGFQMLRELDGNLIPASEDAGPAYSGSSYDALLAMLDGEHPSVLALCNMADVVIASQRGEPVYYVIPNHGFLVMPRGLAVARDAGELAGAFYDFVVQPEIMLALATEHQIVPSLDVGADAVVPWIRDVRSHLRSTNHQAVLAEAARWMATFQNEIRGSVQRRFALFDQTFEWLFTILFVVAGIVAAVKLTREEKAEEVRQ
jgi:ABC-type Fe3+ transport system substrate-binding protein